MGCGHVSTVTLSSDVRARARRGKALNAGLPGAMELVALDDVLSELPLDVGRQRDEVGRRLRARAAVLPPGPFDMRALLPRPEGWVGVLLMEGLLHGELDAGKAHVGWLLGEDDLLRPWELDNYALTRRTSWRALSETVIALLDADFERRAMFVPGLMTALLARAQRTSHWLIAKSLIISSPIIEERILLLFALLGERWGKVSAAGVRLELPLTHALIARLVGARRPTVTMTLKSLHEKRVCRRDEHGCWLLTPGDDSVVSPAWQLYREALGCDSPGS